MPPHVTYFFRRVAVGFRFSLDNGGGSMNPSLIDCAMYVVENKPPFVILIEVFAENEPVQSPELL